MQHSNHARLPNRSNENRPRAADQPSFVPFELSNFAPHRVQLLRDCAEIGGNLLLLLFITLLDVDRDKVRDVLGRTCSPRGTDWSNVAGCRQSETANRMLPAEVEMQIKPQRPFRTVAKVIFGFEDRIVCLANFFENRPAELGSFFVRVDGSRNAPEPIRIGVASRPLLERRGWILQDDGI